MAEGTLPADEPARRRYGVRGGSWAWLAGLALIGAMVAWIVFAVVADDDVVLVVPQGGEVEVEEGDTVRVSGTVRDFEFEPTFGEEGDFEEFDESNAIVATSIEPAGEDADSDADFEDIVEDEGLEGQQVTVVGEVEDDDVGETAFTIEESD